MGIGDLALEAMTELAAIDGPEAESKKTSLGIARQLLGVQI